MSQRDFFTTPDGCKLEFETAGTGYPVLWQHGLGAAFAQPACVFPQTDGLKRITLACRGHEGSDLGDPEKISMATFAEDAIALLDYLGIATADVGGISLGSGIALRLAAFHASRVRRLVLARPAWVDQPSLETQGAYLTVAQVVQEFGVTEGLKRIQERPEYLSLLEASPDNAKSILSYFSRPRPETTIALLSRISASSPGVSRVDISRIGSPTLVIGNGQDLVHPLTYAHELAGLIPEAQLVVITSKTVNAFSYEREFQSALAHFLLEAA